MPQFHKKLARLLLSMTQFKRPEFTGCYEDCSTLMSAPLTQRGCLSELILGGKIAAHSVILREVKCRYTEERYSGARSTSETALTQERFMPFISQPL